MAETEFRLQRVGEIALITIDNDEDWTKPTFFGRHAFESLQGVLDAVESQSWEGLVLTGKPFVWALWIGNERLTPELSSRLFSASSLIQAGNAHYAAPWREKLMLRLMRYQELDPKLDELLERRSATS